MFFSPKTGVRYGPQSGKPFMYKFDVKNQFHFFKLFIIQHHDVSVILTVIASLGEDDEEKGKRNAALTVNPR
jgi:hypothetical protein